MNTQWYVQWCRRYRMKGSVKYMLPWIPAQRGRAFMGETSRIEVSVRLRTVNARNSGHLHTAGLPSSAHFLTAGFIATFIGFRRENVFAVIIALIKSVIVFICTCAHCWSSIGFHGIVAEIHTYCTVHVLWPDQHSYYMFAYIFRRLLQIRAKNSNKKI